MAFLDKDDSGVSDAVHGFRCLERDVAVSQCRNCGIDIIDAIRNMLVAGPVPFKKRFHVTFPEEFEQLEKDAVEIKKDSPDSKLFESFVTHSIDIPVCVELACDVCVPDCGTNVIDLRRVHLI